MNEREGPRLRVFIGDDEDASGDSVLAVMNKGDEAVPLSSGKTTDIAELRKRFLAVRDAFRRTMEERRRRRAREEVTDFIDYLRELILQGQWEDACLLASWILKVAQRRDAYPMQLRRALTYVTCCELWQIDDRTPAQEDRFQQLMADIQRESCQHVDVRYDQRMKTLLERARKELADKLQVMRICEQPHGDESGADREE